MGIEVVSRADLEQTLKQFSQQLNEIKDQQLEILSRLDKMKGGPDLLTPDYMSAINFMKAVGIGRWKFDQLIAGNMIRTIKKKRKIYVPVTEVKRFFLDPHIQ